MVSKTFELIKVENRMVGGRWGDEQMLTKGSRRSVLGMDVFADPACSLVTVVNNTALPTEVGREGKAGLGSESGVSGKPPVLHYP